MRAVESSMCGKRSTSNRIITCGKTQLVMSLANQDFLGSKSKCTNWFGNAKCSQSDKSLASVRACSNAIFRSELIGYGVSFAVRLWICWSVARIMLNWHLVVCSTFACMLLNCCRTVLLGWGTYTAALIALDQHRACSSKCPNLVWIFF